MIPWTVVVLAGKRSRGPVVPACRSKRRRSLLLCSPHLKLLDFVRLSASIVTTRAYPKPFSDLAIALHRDSKRQAGKRQADRLASDLHIDCVPEQDRGLKSSLLVGVNKVCMPIIIINHEARSGRRANFKSKCVITAGCKLGTYWGEEERRGKEREQKQAAILEPKEPEKFVRETSEPYINSDELTINRLREICQKKPITSSRLYY